MNLPWCTYWILPTFAASHLSSSFILVYSNHPLIVDTWKFEELVGSSRKGNKARNAKIERLHPVIHFVLQHSLPLISVPFESLCLASNYSGWCVRRAEELSAISQQNQALIFKIFEILQLSVERPQLFPPWVPEFRHAFGFCHSGGCERQVSSERAPEGFASSWRSLCQELKGQWWGCGQRRQWLPPSYITPASDFSCKFRGIA